MSLTPYRRRALMAALIASQVGLLVWTGADHWPTNDEMAHLPAGISHWQFGRFDLYPVNPPLARMVAALPVLFARPELDWSRYFQGGRPEFIVGDDFLAANGNADAVKYFAIARWGCIVLMLLGAWACYALAKSLYDGAGGLIALICWCFSPTVLANGAMVMPDAGAAAVGITAILFLRRWLYRGTRRAAANAGLWVGLANLTKTTWLVLFVLAPVLWAVRRLLLPASGDTLRCGGITEPRPTDSLTPSPTLGKLATLLMVAIFVMNLGYAFQGSFTRLGDYVFVSELFRGESVGTERATNRFANTWTAAVPVPLPRPYVEGIDYFKSELEFGKGSYLRGEWRHGGWWYYYLYAMLVKEPVGLLLLVGAAGVSTILALARRRMTRQAIFDELILLLSAAAVLVLVSSQTGFNHHLRYVLPAFPFFFVWIGKLGPWLKRPGHFKRGFVAAMLAWAVVSSLAVCPHSHSYFNELAGGPANGWKHLHHSSVDWGQDLLDLKSWVERHPEVKPIGIAAYRSYDLVRVGLETADPKRWPPGGRERTLPEEQIGPQPGWFVVSIRHLAGEPAGSYWGKPSENYKNDPSRSYFRFFEPVDRIGYSMNIYHVTLDECNRVRRRLGLVQLPRDWARESTVEAPQPGG